MECFPRFFVTAFGISKRIGQDILEILRLFFHTICTVRPIDIDKFEVWVFLKYLLTDELTQYVLPDRGVARITMTCFSRNSFIVASTSASLGVR